MLSGRENLRTGIGLGLSVLAHGAVLLPWLYAASQGTGEQAHLDPALKAPEPTTAPLKPVLGIDAPTPTSLTWIGYEEYEEHLAQLSEVEQAAFTELPTPIAPQPVEPASPATSPVADPARRVETEVAETGDPITAVAAAPDPTGPLRVVADEARVEQVAASDASVAAQVTEIGAVQPDVDRGPAPLVAIPSETSDPRLGASAVVEGPPIPVDGEVPGKQDPLDAARAQDLLVQGPPVPSEITEARARESEQPASSGAEQPPANQHPPVQSDPKEGDPAEKESRATSTIEVPLDEIRAGKPLASHGLELFPAKPEFSITTRLTASPRNPLVEIRFRPNGQPILARIVESSGDTRVDNDLLSSLYRWRARGKPLESLKDEDTTNVRIRILLR